MTRPHHNACYKRVISYDPQPGTEVSPQPASGPADGGLRAVRGNQVPGTVYRFTGRGRPSRVRLQDQAMTWEDWRIAIAMALPASALIGAAALVAVFG